MNDTENEVQFSEAYDEESFDFDELEKKLNADLEEELSDLELLKADREKIANPNSLGDTVLNVVHEQLVNLIGVEAGKEFIEKNNGLNLDLRKEAHIQTTENFAEGKIATHNTKIDYQERYDKWQSNLEHDDNGNVITHTTRSGKEEANLVKGARKPYDDGRPKGSAEKGTDIDHTVSAAEIIRDPAANAHMTEEERIAFANSEKNLNEMDSSLNRSKGDKSMDEWLDNPNANGQKPSEIFDISEEQERELREKDAEAREEYEKQKKEGEERSIKAGKQSRREEAFRMGGEALKSAVMSMLVSLIHTIIQKFIAWLRAKEKSLSTFIEQMKDAIKTFVANLKQELMTAGSTALTTIATAIIGPVVGTIKKAWMLLKQGAKTIKEAIAYVKNPENKNQPLSITMLKVGEIVMGGVAAVGAIALGQAITSGLETIPIFKFPIPVIGSLASILGIFLGALVAGLVGALALNLMERAVADIERRNNTRQQIEKGNEILNTQNELICVKEEKLHQSMENMVENIMEQNRAVDSYIRATHDEIQESHKKADSDFAEFKRVLRSLQEE